MKLLVGDGREVKVYDLGLLIMHLRATAAPLKLHGVLVLEDDAARERLREVMIVGNYERVS